MSIYGEARTRDLYFPTIDAISTRVTALEVGGGGGAPFDPTDIEADTTALGARSTLIEGDVLTLTTAVGDHESRIIDLEGGGGSGGGGGGGGTDYIAPAEYAPDSLKKNTILYMDFSEPADLMRDYSKNEANVSKTVNNGCTYQSDFINGDSNTTRKYSLRVDSCNKQWYSASNIGQLGIGGVPGTIPASGSGNFTNGKWYSNYTGLNLSQYAPLLKVPAITLSIWFKIDADMLAGTRLNLFSMGEGTTAGFNFHANAIVGTGLFFDLYQGTTPLLRTMAGHNVLGPERNLGRIGWNHMVFTMDETGNKVFTNGTYIDTTVEGWNHGNGTTATYVNFSAENIKYFHLGTWARLEGNAEVYDINGNVSNMTHSRVFWGNIADLLILDRKITDAEALGLYNDEYGYDLLMFAGQSNMVGSLDSPIGAEESDFTGIESVLKYNIPSNISNYGTGSALIGTPVFANNIYDLVPSLGPFRGLWMNFTREYMKIEKRPYKRKALILQVAYGNRGFYGANNAWHPTTGFLTKCLIGASQQIISDHPFTDVVSFCWNQGETDIVNLNPSYGTDFNSFITQLNTIPTFANKPIILAKISSPEYAPFVNGLGKKMITIVNDAMAAICNGVPNRRLVETSALTYTPGDLWHYDTNALRKLGLLYFAQYVDILKTGQNSVANFIESIALKPSLKYNNLALTGYYRYSFSPAGSGAAVVAAYPLVLTRFGNMCVIQSNTAVAFTVASVDFPLTLTAMPVEFRPASKLNFSIFGLNASTNDTYVLSVFPDGLITIADSSGNGGFTFAAAISVQSFSVTYVV